MNKRTIASHLEPWEYTALQDLARRNRVTVSTFVRSIIVDALVEEGHDFSQCSRSKISAQAGESFANSRGSAS